MSRPRLPDVETAPGYFPPPHVTGVIVSYPLRISVYFMARSRSCRGTRIRVAAAAAVMKRSCLAWLRAAARRTTKPAGPGPQRRADPAERPENAALALGLWRSYPPPVRAGI